jgi:UDP-glucose 6-dehydrogenase
VPIFPLTIAYNNIIATTTLPIAGVLVLSGIIIDMREDSSIRVIDRLRKKGARIISYDPMAMHNFERRAKASIVFLVSAGV